MQDSQKRILFHGGEGDGMMEYVKIYCCGDCIHYNWKKHKCNRGATQEGKPQDHFFRDCPIGICEEEDSDEVTE